MTLPSNIPKNKGSIKIEPMLAWSLNPEDTTVSRTALGVKYEKSDASKPLFKRLRCYYLFFLLFGLDISGNATQSRKISMVVMRFVSLGFMMFTFIWYWIETFLTLKDEYIEYGATLVHLVVAAQISSAMICHCIIHSRMEKMMGLINKLDETNSELPVAWTEMKKTAISFGTGLTFLILYLAIPIKWKPGPFFENPKSDMTTKSFMVHLVAFRVVKCPLMSLLVVLVCSFDVVFLSFFVQFTQRFYCVFRRSPFVKLLEKSTKDDLCLIMQEFRKHHFTISNFVEDVDGVFSPLILIWYVYLTLAMCCWIRAFNTEMFMIVMGGLTVMFSLVVAFIQFFILSSATSTVNDEVTAHLDTVRIMCIKEDISAKASMDVVQERISHLSYVTCVLASPVTLTGWGFFSISKGFVLTVSSTVLTFTLVLYGV